MVMAIS